MFSSNNAFAAIDPNGLLGGESFGGGGGGLPDISIGATEEGCRGCGCKKKCMCNERLGSQGHWFKKEGVIAIDFNDAFRGLKAGTYKFSSAFLLDETSSRDDIDSITGNGYINIPVMDSKENWNHYYICEVCEEQKFTNFREWLKACIEYYGYNYTGEKITVYPNPSAENSTIEIEPEYIKSVGVKTVTYELYNSNQELIRTIETSTPSANVEIPSTDLLQKGAYLLKCDVKTENNANNETITVPIMISE